MNKSIFLAAVLISMLVMPFMVSAQTWCNSTRSYRVPITITPGITVNNASFQIVLNTSTLDFSHLKSPRGEEFLVTDSSCKTYNHFLETPNMSSTDFSNFPLWVKLPTAAAGTPQTIYLYYRNNTPLDSESSCDNTFHGCIEYDDTAEWDGGVTINNVDNSQTTTESFLNLTESNAGNAISSRRLASGTNTGMLSNDSLLIMRWNLHDITGVNDNVRLELRDKVLISTGTLMHFSRPAESHTNCQVSTQGDDGDLVICFDQNTVGDLNVLLANQLQKDKWYRQIITWNVTSAAGGNGSTSQLWNRDYTHNITVFNVTDVDNTKIKNVSIGSGDSAAGMEFYLQFAAITNLTNALISFGSEEIITTANITIQEPANTTYYTTTLELNVTNSTPIKAWSYNLDNTGNITFTPNTTITALGGPHHIVLWANDTGGFQYTDDVYFHVFMGINVSVFTNDTGVLSGWVISATNGSFNTSFSGNSNPALFEQSDLPFNITQVTVNDGSSTLYYLNQTNQTIINNTVLNEMTFNLTLKPPNPLAITFSPSQTIDINTEATILCASPEGSPSLTRDNVGVSNPHKFLGSVGDYIFNCSISTETASYKPDSVVRTLTITQGVVGCTDSGVFAFSYQQRNSNNNWTEFNFTDFVSINFSKPSLTDIYSPNVTLFVNVTNGYYVIANTTSVKNFDLYWGNYFPNNTYQQRPLNTTPTILSQYTQNNPYYVFTIYDELSKIQRLPPSANTTMTLLCPDGQSTFNFNDSRFLVSTRSIATDAMAGVSYPASSYIRSYILGSQAEFRNVYTVDALTETLYQIPFEMLDFTFWDSSIHIYKQSSSGDVIITEGYFDSDHILNTYLIKDNKYYIRLKRGSEVREVGFLLAVVAGTQQISISDITLTPQVSVLGDKIKISASIDNTTNILRINYNDSLQQTNSVRFRVYEDANQTALYDQTFINTSDITISISSGINTSKRYGIHVSVEHSSLGNSPVDFVLGAGAFGILANLGPMVPGWIYQAISFVIVFFIGIITTPRLRMAGFILMAGTIGMIYYLGWFSAASATTVLLIVFVALSIVYEIRRGRLT